MLGCPCCSGRSPVDLIDDPEATLQQFQLSEDAYRVHCQAQRSSARSMAELLGDVGGQQLEIRLEGSAAELAEGGRLRVGTSGLDSMAFVMKRIEAALRVPASRWLLIAKRYRDAGAVPQIFPLMGGEFPVQHGLVEASCHVHLIPAILQELEAFNQRLEEEIKALAAAQPLLHFTGLEGLAAGQLPESAAGSWSRTAQAAFRLLPLAEQEHAPQAQEGWRAYCMSRAKAQLEQSAMKEMAALETPTGKTKFDSPQANVEHVLAQCGLTPEETALLRHSIVLHWLDVAFEDFDRPRLVHAACRVYAVDGSAAVDLDFVYHKRALWSSIEFWTGVQYCLVAPATTDFSPSSGSNPHHPAPPWAALFSTTIKDAYGEVEDQRMPLTPEALAQLRHHLFTQLPSMQQQRQQPGQQQGDAAAGQRQQPGGEGAGASAALCAKLSDLQLAHLLLAACGCKIERGWPCSWELPLSKRRWEARRLREVCTAPAAPPSEGSEGYMDEGEDVSESSEGQDGSARN